MELFLILFLTLLNGVFALSEIAIVSSRKIRLQQMAESGSASAQTALELAESPNNFLSTVQIGITLINILLGVFSGGSISRFLNDAVFQNIGFLASYGEAISTGIVIVMTMYLSIVIGELVPKRYALQNPERLALIIARPMSVLALFASPLVKLLSISTELILRLLGVHGNPSDSVTDTELLSMVEQGIAEGMFEETEHDMIEGVLRLDNVRAAGIMTPRVDLTWLEVDATQDEIRQILAENTYDFYPVAKESIDNLLGVVSSKALLSCVIRGESLDLRSLMQTPIFAPETMTAAKVLNAIKASEVHMAVVIGEHGGIEGILTVNDIFEEIVGQMADDDPEVSQRADGSWLLSGMLPIYRLEEILHSITLPEDETGEYFTLAGFVLFRLGHVPKTTESFTWEGHIFEVVDLDGNQIDKVLVYKV